jgi:hypothetical protein
VASLTRLLLFAAPLFIALVGLAHFRFGYQSISPFDFENGLINNNDTMGGGDSYRSVAYFVNVSCSHTLMGKEVSLH